MVFSAPPPRGGGFLRRRLFAAAAATALAEMALAVAERRAADLQGGFSSRVPCFSYHCGTETFVSLADYNEDEAVWGGVCGVVPSFCHSQNKKT